MSDTSTPGSSNIIVLGSLHMDMLVRVPHIPQKGETLPGHSLTLRMGGKGGNQAIYASIHGGKVFMIGRVGEDEFGRKIVRTLQICGVDTRCVTVTPGIDSGVSVALIDEEEGDYGAVILSGVNLRLDQSDVSSMISLIDSYGAGCLVLQAEIPLPVIEAAAKAARARAIRVIFNAAPAKKEHKFILSLIDILVVNQFEAGILTGKNVADLEKADWALRQLAKQVPTVLLTLGKNGVLATNPQVDRLHLPAHRVTVADAHGAGDSFIGSFSARLLAGDTFEGASRYANAAAALTVTHAGPHSKEVTPELVRKLLSS